MHGSTIVVLLILGIAPAWAADDGLMSSRIGNTVLVNSSVGDARMYFNADHTFTGKIIMGFIHLPLKGTWKVEGSKLCMTYDTPPPGESNPDCAALTVHAVGDTWEADGRKITLLKGVQ